MSARQHTWQHAHDARPLSIRQRENEIGESVFDYDGEAVWRQEQLQQGRYPRVVSRRHTFQPLSQLCCLGGDWGGVIGRTLWIESWDRMIL